MTLGSNLMQQGDPLVQKLNAEIKRKDALIRELVAALEFYVNPEIYKPHPHGLGFDNRDLSFSAKAALIKAKEQGTIGDPCRDALQAIINWADFALKNKAEFDSHGVMVLDGPAFDKARAALAKAKAAGFEP
jgi:hypothetical protein